MVRAALPETRVVSRLPFAKSVETELHKVPSEGGASAYPKISSELNLISNTGIPQSTVLRKYTFPLTECKLVNSFQQLKNVVKHDLSRKEATSSAATSLTALLITIALSRSAKLYFFIDI